MAHYLKQYENAMKTYTCGRGLKMYSASKILLKYVGSLLPLPFFRLHLWGFLFSILIIGPRNVSFVLKSDLIKQDS